MTKNPKPLMMEQVNDPAELENARRQDTRFARNSAWLQGHVGDVYAQHRGKCICVAGEELFVAETAEAVLALAEVAHPEDDGQLLRYIPKEKTARIYAH